MRSWCWGRGFHPVMDTYSFYLSREEVNESGLD